MARNNPSNPYTRDEGHTQKDVPMPLAKAKVLDASGMPDENGFHSAKIRVYGDDAPYMAPVIAPTHGSVWVPKPGTDVAVMFGSSDKPWVIGAWYPLDRVEEGEVDMPAYEPGDIRLGNQSGSSITVDNNGDVRVETGDDEFLVDGKTTSGTYSDEDAQDAVGGALSTQFTYDDANNAINLNPHASTTDAHHTRYTDEEAQDAVGGALSSSFTYDDVNNLINLNPHISTSDAHHTRYTNEEAQDAVGGILSTQFTYDDTNNAINLNPHASTTDAHHTRYSDAEARSVAEAVEKFSYSTGHTAWGTTSGAENINRIDLQSGESFKPQRLDVQLKGGGSNTSFTVDVYDATNATVLLSTSAGSVAQNGTESPTGVTIVVRVDNSTGSTQTASITSNGVIR